MMLDSGASGNYMTMEFADRNNIPTVTKKDPYSLRVINGSAANLNRGIIDQETLPVEVKIGQHTELLCFDIVGMASHDAVIGIPWLRKHNPEIDRNTEKLVFTRCSCTVIPSEEDESWMESPSFTETTRRKIRQLEKNKLGSTKRLWVRPTRRDLHATAEQTTTSGDHTVPEQYREYMDLFTDEEGKMLPKHQPWDHVIPLEEGKEPTYGPMYNLSQRELEVLKDYIDTNLRRGYIQPSTSPAGYRILFAPKKDGKLRLCVDY